MQIITQNNPKTQTKLNFKQKTFLLWLRYKKLKWRVLLSWASWMWILICFETSCFETMCIVQSAVQINVNWIKWVTFEYRRWDDYNNRKAIHLLSETESAFIRQVLTHLRNWIWVYRRLSTKKRKSCHHFLTLFVHTMKVNGIQNNTGTHWLSVNEQRSTTEILFKIYVQQKIFISQKHCYQLCQKHCYQLWLQVLSLPTVV